MRDSACDRLMFDSWQQLQDVPGIADRILRNAVVYCLSQLRITDPSPQYQASQDAIGILDDLRAQIERETE